MTSVHETASALLKEGDAAPKFKLQAYPEGEISLDQFIGKKNVILAFYPKDDTPGCTKEMCSFSDDLSHFSAADTQVLGISCDNVASHEKFAGKFSLKQPLLADPEAQVAKAYGTVKETGTSANRKLFVIDKKGIIRHIHEGMPTNETLLAFVKDLK
jgi:thioredoxin-dependent peroxiredoxin